MTHHGTASAARQPGMQALMADGRLGEAITPGEVSSSHLRRRRVAKGSRHHRVVSFCKQCEPEYPGEAGR
jgi:hypothetical protein